MTIKAIETHYNGYRFRSRLEARWAVFFDALDVEYEYEPEGFDLDGTLYLPDFWLPNHNVWIEVKGAKPSDGEIKKAALLCLGTKQRVIILSGTMGIDKFNIVAFFEFCDESEVEQTFSAELKKLSATPWIDCLADEIPKDWIDFENRQVAFPNIPLHSNSRGSFALGRKDSRELWVLDEDGFGGTCLNPIVMNSCRVPVSHHARLEHAYRAARSARFEHGESG